MRAIATWCVRHRRIVVGAWIVALIALSVIAQGVGSTYKDSFSLSGTQSFDALNLLQKVAPKASGDREQIVFAVEQGKVTDPAARSRIEAMLAKVEALPTVASVASPFAPGGDAQIASSGQVAFANVTLAKQAIGITKSEAERLRRHGPGRPTATGSRSRCRDRSRRPRARASVNSVGFGAAAALVVLLLVFGSLLAAALPLLTAGIALGSSVAVISLLSHLMGVASFSSELSLLIGLGVGVDYALFIVVRHRQGLQRGKTVEQAIVDAVDTSGRAVMFAGITVCIALLGMFALGVSFLYGVAVVGERRRPLHRARRADAAAGAARLLRDEGARPQGAPQARRRRADDERRVRRLGALGAARSATGPR